MGRLRGLKLFLVRWLAISYLVGCSSMDHEAGMLSYCVAMAIVLGFALIVMRGI